MKTKAMIGHGLWAAIALGAFFTGSARQPSAPSDRSAGSQQPKLAVSALGSSPADVVTGTLDSSSKSKGGGLTAGATAFSPDDTSFEALAEQAVRAPNPITRRLAFSRLLESLTVENAMEIREQLVAFGADGDAWRDFNYSWGALAGEEAVVFAASSEERDLDAAISGWASASPDDAIAFLDNLPDNLRGNREGLAASIVAGLADRAPELAADLVIRLASEGSGGADKLMETVANKALRTRDIEDAVAWSELLPDGALKAAAMDRVADAYVRRDPEAAARWAQQFADQEYATRVIEEVGDGWAERDPVAAVSWLESLPEGRAQVSGLSSAFGDWEDRDPRAASEYLLSMPKSEQRDFAISGFSKGYAWQDPEAAIAWAQDIGDPSLRQETLTRAGQAYLRRDPEAARAWLQSSGLPPESQEQVLQSRRR